MVENMRYASTEPGTITKASSDRTAHSERWSRPACVFISRRQNMVVKPGMAASGRPPLAGLLLNLVLTQDLLTELWGDAKHEPGLLLQQRAVDTYVQAPGVKAHRTA